MTAAAETTVGAGTLDDGRPVVERVVALALALSLAASDGPAGRAEELARLAAHDRTVIGRAWLSLVVPALRTGEPSLVAAERLLAAALESEGQGERSGDEGGACLRMAS